MHWLDSLVRLDPPARFGVGVGVRVGVTGYEFGVAVTVRVRVAGNRAK